MNDQNPNRQPAGVPIGGQFAPSAKTESDVALTEVFPERPSEAPYCAQCGSTMLADPDGSPGVFVHADADGQPDYDADLDHAPVPEESVPDIGITGAQSGTTLAAALNNPFTVGASVNDGSTPYVLDEWVQDGPVRVALTDIGEGWEGDYDEDDPTDEPLLRVDCAVRADVAKERGWPEEYAHTDGDGTEWYFPPDYSICTRINRDEVTPEGMRAFLKSAAADVRDSVEGGGSVKGLMDSLSWTSTAEVSQMGRPPGVTEPLDVPPIPETWDAMPSGALVKKHPDGGFIAQSAGSPGQVLAYPAGYHPSNGGPAKFDSEAEAWAAISGAQAATPGSGPTGA